MNPWYLLLIVPVLVVVGFFLFSILHQCPAPPGFRRELVLGAPRKQRERKVPVKLELNEEVPGTLPSPLVDDDGDTIDPSLITSTEPYTSDPSVVEAVLGTTPGEDVVLRAKGFGSAVAGLKVNITDGPATGFGLITAPIDVGVQTPVGDLALGSVRKQPI